MTRCHFRRTGSEDECFRQLLKAELQCGPSPPYIPRAVQLGLRACCPDFWGSLCTASAATGPTWGESASPLPRGFPRAEGREPFVLGGARTGIVPTHRGSSSPSCPIPKHRRLQRLAGSSGGCPPEYDVWHELGGHLRSSHFALVLLLQRERL